MAAGSNPQKIGGEPHEVHRARHRDASSTDVIGARADFGARADYRLRPDRVWAVILVDGQGLMNTRSSST
jgi:hypothetical protein